MAVPTGHVLRIKAGELPCLDDHVLEDLVGRMAHVDLAVRIRRAVVQHEEGLSATGIAQARVAAFLFPLGDPAGLSLGQVAPHRERCVGQVQRVAVVAAFSGCVRGRAVRTASRLFIHGAGVARRARRLTVGWGRKGRSFGTNGAKGSTLKGDILARGSIGLEGVRAGLASEDANRRPCRSKGQDRIRSRVVWRRVLGPWGSRLHPAGRLESPLGCIW
jgi:hypothetical protein